MHVGYCVLPVEISTWFVGLALLLLEVLLVFVLISVLSDNLLSSFLLF